LTQRRNEAVSQDAAAVLAGLAADDAAAEAAGAAGAAVFSGAAATGLATSPLDGAAASDPVPEPAAAGTVEDCPDRLSLR
jgi:hypothetical protein